MQVPEHEAGEQGSATFGGAGDDQALLREVVAFYERTLQASPEALGWLERQGVRAPDALERFRLGYANRTLGLALPPGDRKAGAEVRARLQRLGILRESGHEHLAGSLVIPIFDERGAAAQMYGRKIGKGLRVGTPLHLYLPGPLRGVWNAEGLAGREVILCGSLLDALSVWSAGPRNVTAALTLDEVPIDVLAALEKRGVKTVLVAYPGGEKGDAAAMMVSDALHAKGIAAARVALPGDMGPNEFVRRRGAAALLAALQHARSLGDRELAAGATVPGAAAGSVVARAANDAAPAISPAAASRAGAVTSPIVARTDAVADDVVLDFEDRRYRVRGMERNTSAAQLKVNLLATRQGGGSGSYHVDTLDLYAAKQRAAFVRQAAGELGVPEDVVKRDIGRVLFRLEEVQTEIIQKTLAPREPVAMSEAEEAAAMDLLRDPALLDRIAQDFERCGIVGERTNLLVGYLAAISRKLEKPLAVVIQSSSAAGKTALLDAILAMVPPEDQLRFSALTPQAIYYLGASDIRHKVLAISEEEGAAKASYALKLLQSEGELKIASTSKDSTGRLVAEEYVVRGPVALFFTTTAVQVDEELMNRCIVLTVDEGREQTRAIHRLQRERETLDGLAAQEARAEILKLHQDAQRLLRPVRVANPYAPRLTFLDDRTRMRRDHGKYLALIRAVALLHQCARELKHTTVGGREIEYVEAASGDIAFANRLADEVLGNSLDDLPPHTRRLLGWLHEMVAASCAAEGIDRREYRFTRRAVREHCGMGDTQLKIHLRRLVELEYLVVHRNGRGQAYELAYDGRGRDGERFLPGLIDPEESCGGERSGSGRGAVGPRSAAGRAGKTGERPNNGAAMNAASSSGHEIGQPGRARERVAVVAGEAP